MKNLFYFLLISIFILMSSCKQDAKVEIIQAQEAVTFEFSKKITIFDKNKNSTDLIIHAHSQKVLDTQTKNIFTLITRTEERVVSADVHTSFDNSDVIGENDNEGERAENYVYVYITNRKFKKDVKAFSIRSSREYGNQSADQKVRITIDEYGFGADGVVGAWVEYIAETRPREFYTVKLSKKTAASNIFWQPLASRTLYSIGEEFWYCGTIPWLGFRLRMIAHKARANTCCTGRRWEFLLVGC